LLDPAEKARVAFKFDEIPLHAALRIPQGDTKSRLRTLLLDLSRSQNDEHDAVLALRSGKQYPLPVRSNGQTAGNVTWRQWRYLGGFAPAPAELIGYLIGSGGDKYEKY